AWIRAHRGEVTSPFLLDVLCDYLDVWSAPGVLLIGDAAHPMSPVGAQGINIALRDALVTANHLGPQLLDGVGGLELDAAARGVVDERMPEVVRIQRFQDGPPRVLLRQSPLARFAMAVIVPLAMRTGVVRLLIRTVIARYAMGTTKVKLAF
ncbi:MAG: FAD-dependent monooxygenase, partial [bacterium]